MKKILAIALFLLATTAFGQVAPSHMLVYSGDGAKTYIVLTNPLDHDVSYPDSTVCDPFGQCTTVKGLKVAPKSFVRVGPVYPPVPFNVGALDVRPPDPSVLIDSEVITGAGAIFRHAPLKPLTVARWFNLIAAGTSSRYNSWIIIIATANNTTISYNGQRSVLNANQGILLPGPLDGRAEFTTYVGYEFYAVGGINDSVTGSQGPVDPNEIR